MNPRTRGFRRSVGDLRYYVEYNCYYHNDSVAVYRVGPDGHTVEWGKLLARREGRDLLAYYEGLKKPPALESALMELVL